MTYMSTTENPECPDHSSHWENAQDRLFGGRTDLTVEEFEQLDAEAQIEYMACEGH